MSYGIFFDFSLTLVVFDKTFTVSIALHNPRFKFVVLVRREREDQNISENYDVIVGHKKHEPDLD